MLGVQGFNNNSDNYFEGWESIRQYLNNEMEKIEPSFESMYHLGLSS